jgi:hypothetical protein
MNIQEKIALCKLLMDLAAIDGMPNDNELMYIFQLGNKLAISQTEWQQLKSISAESALSIIKSFDDSTKMKLPFMIYHLINSDNPANSQEIRGFELIMNAIGVPCSYNSFHAMIEGADAESPR